MYIGMCMCVQVLSHGHGHVCEREQAHAQVLHMGVPLCV